MPTGCSSRCQRARLPANRTCGCLWSLSGMGTGAATTSTVSYKRAAVVARFGHRVNANTHKPIRFTSGTNARIVHHRLRPARCRIFATGTATMMINRSGIPRGMSQCHSGGIALQNQNWSQKIPFSFLPRFLRPPVALYNKAAIRSGMLVSRWTQGATCLLCLLRQPFA